MKILDYSKYCVLDVETNGLDSAFDDLLSISIYFPDTDEYYERFFPLTQGNVYTTHINGITKEMLKGKTPWSQIEIEDIVAKYNIASRTVLTYGSLDEKFLSSYFARHDLLGFERFNFFNMKKLILASSFSEGNITKDNLCQLLGIQGVKNVHSGKNDCYLEWELFKVLHNTPLVITDNRVGLLSPEYIVPVSKLAYFPNFKYHRVIRSFSQETTLLKNWDISAEDYRIINLFGNVKGFLVEHMLNTYLKVEKQDNQEFLINNAAKNKFIGVLPSATEQIPIVLKSDGTVSVPVEGGDIYEDIFNQTIIKLRPIMKDIAQYISDNIFTDGVILSQELVVDEKDNVLALCDLSNEQSILEIKAGMFYDPVQLYYESNGRNIYLLKTTTACTKSFVSFELHQITLTEEQNTTQTMASKRLAKKKALSEALSQNNINLVHLYNGTHKALLCCTTCGHEWVMAGNKVTPKSKCPQCKEKLKLQKEKRKQKNMSDKKSKVTSTVMTARPVRNITTGRVFKSAKQAARLYDGIPSYIVNCCRGKVSSAYRCQWEFVDTDGNIIPNSSFE